MIVERDVYIKLEAVFGFPALEVVLYSVSRSGANEFICRTSARWWQLCFV